jgi:delta-aminolevulinic acid dehydratase/porphobilinogen synthase
VGEAMQVGIKSIILFPKIPEALKSNFADECYNPTGIVPRAVRNGQRARAWTTAMPANCRCVIDMKSASSPMP